MCTTAAITADKNTGGELSSAVELPRASRGLSVGPAIGDDIHAGVSAQSVWPRLYTFVDREVLSSQFHSLRLSLGECVCAEAYEG